MTTASGRPRAIRRVCVIRMGGMGDILLATPAVRALWHHLGEPEIDFIVAKGMKPALEGIPYIRDVIEFDKNPSTGDGRVKRLIPFLRRVKERRYDLVINFQPSLKSFAIAAASGAGRVLTFKKRANPSRQTGRVLHAIDDYSKELKPLGIPAVADRRMDFVVPDAARESVAALLREAGIGDRDPLLVVNPAGTRIINRWPPERFSKFLDRMAAEMPFIRLVLIGGPHDLSLAGAIADGTTAPVLNLAGKINVKELGALLLRASVVLTGDTGPLHIASALGTPIVCLSGAADPDRTGPVSPRDLVVINRDLPCVPCRGRSCKRGDIACMTQMPVAWVFDAVKRRLGNVGVEAGVK